MNTHTCKVGSVAKMKPSEDTTMVTRMAMALYSAPREEVGSSKKKKMRSDILNLLTTPQEEKGKKNKTGNGNLRLMAFAQGWNGGGSYAV